MAESSGRRPIARIAATGALIFVTAILVAVFIVGPAHIFTLKFGVLPVFGVLTLVAVISWLVAELLYRKSRL